MHKDALLLQPSPVLLTVLTRRRARKAQLRQSGDGKGADHRDQRRDLDNAGAWREKLQGDDLRVQRGHGIGRQACRMPGSFRVSVSVGVNVRTRVLGLGQSPLLFRSLDPEHARKVYIYM